MLTEKRKINLGHNFLRWFDLLNEIANWSMIQYGGVGGKGDGGVKELDEICDKFGIGFSDAITIALAIQRQSSKLTGDCFMWPHDFKAWPVITCRAAVQDVLELWEQDQSRKHVVR